MALLGRVDAKGEVGTPENLFASHHINQFLVQGWFIEQGAGREVIINVCYLPANFGIQFEKRKQTAGMGENDFEFRQFSGLSMKLIVRSGHPSRVVVSDLFGHVEIDGPPIFRGKA